MKKTVRFIPKEIIDNPDPMAAIDLTLPIHQKEINYDFMMDHNSLNTSDNGDVTLNIEIQGKNDRLRVNFFEPKNEQILDPRLPQDYAVLTMIDEVMAIISDPAKIAKYLQPLNSELAQRMQEEGLDISQMPKPKYLIAGKESFIPGFPTEFILHNKNKILEEILLRKENENGLNLEGPVSFTGAVDPDDAELFLLEHPGPFQEDAQISRMLLHGKKAHRLIFQVLIEAIKQGDILLPDGYTIKDFFWMTILYKIDFGGRNLIPIWDFLIDNAGNSATCSEDDPALYYKPENYSSNSNSPFTFTSLLTCFGDELGLDALQAYLLDSHYKQTAQMMERLIVKEGLDRTIDKEKLYDHCMMRMSRGQNDSLASISGDFPFTATKEERMKRYIFAQQSIGRKKDSKFAADRNKTMTLEEYIAENTIKEGHNR